MSAKKEVEAHLRARDVRGPFPDGLPWMDIFDFAAMEDSAHLVCPKCAKVAKDGSVLCHPWMEIDICSNGDIKTGCRNCGNSTILKMLSFKLSDGSDLSSIEIKKGFLRCPRCTSPQFCIAKLQGVLCLGCRKCPWQAMASLAQTEGGLYVAN